MPSSATRPACPTAPSPAAPSPAMPRRARSSWSGARRGVPGHRLQHRQRPGSRRHPGGGSSSGSGAWASSSRAPRPLAVPRRPATCWSSPPTPPCRATPTPPPAAHAGCARWKRPARCSSRWSRRAGPIIRSPPRSSASTSTELTAEAAAQGMNPDTLVLGCTHYPLLRPLIEHVIPVGHEGHRLRRVRGRQAAVFYLCHDLRRTADSQTAQPIQILAASPPIRSRSSSASAPAFSAGPPARSSLIDLGGLKFD